MGDHMRRDRDPGVCHVEEEHRSIRPSGEARRRDVAPVRAGVFGDKGGVVNLGTVLAWGPGGPTPERCHHLERWVRVDGAELDRSRGHAQAGRIRQRWPEGGRRGWGRRSGRRPTGQRSLDGRGLAEVSQLHHPEPERADQQHHQAGQGKVSDDHGSFARRSRPGIRASDDPALEIGALGHLVIEVLSLAPESRLDVFPAHHIAIPRSCPTGSSRWRSLPSARWTRTRTVTWGRPMIRAVSLNDWSSK